jgi:hypothetical protein
VTPTVDHCPPAHHAVAIRVSAVIWAAVCVERSGAQAESKCEPGCEAPAPTAAAPAATIPAATFNLAADFKSTFATLVCKQWFVGVWDTVSSVGWYENPLQLPFTGDNPDIEIGRHAIAIDERRAFFRTNLWIPKNPPPYTGPGDLKQVWFPGVHCDVGGGYPEPESGLSKIAERRLCRPRSPCEDA